jgi:hypothetical protein
LHSSGSEGLDCFEVRGTFNPTTQKVTDAPKDFAAAKDGAAAQDKQPDASLALATMDIFAGCGGLSEGMHQVGVCVCVEGRAGACASPTP